MKMASYESLLLLSTESTSNEVDAIETELDQLISKNKGKVAAFDRWGKCKLAYPVKASVYGVYVLIRYQIPIDSISAVHKDFDYFFKIKHGETIVRHINQTIKEEKLSCPVEKPSIINIEQDSNLNSFIKDNKMDGIIKTSIDKKDKSDEKTKESSEKAKPSIDAASTETIEKTENPEKKEIDLGEKVASDETKPEENKEEN